MIVTPAPVLERIPFVLSVAYDAAKSPAVSAAIRGGLSMALSRTLVSRGPCLTNGNEQPLPGGTANRGLVVRVADTVVRPIAPCWPATHALLAHLRAVGFDGAPHVLDVGPSTETLSYVEGQAAVLRCLAIRSPTPPW